MILENAQSNIRPNSVTIENLPDGRQRIVIAKNISEVTEEDGTRMYQFDSAEFYMPEDIVPTQEMIEEGIEDWWSYASEEHECPTIEDRISILEDVVALLMEV